jgi:Phage capsid family
MYAKDLARTKEAALNAAKRDPDAWSRIQQHQKEARIDRAAYGYTERAAGDLKTTDIGAVVVPQYLIDLAAPAVATRRPFADSCTHHDLPAEGMSLIIPRFTQGTSVDIQATQLTSVSSQSMTESDLTIAVQTFAGSQLVSRQAIDRSRVEEFVLQDLIARYSSVLDSTLLNQATHGLSTIALGILGAYADTTPTGAELYPKILAAQSGVEAALLGGRADLVVMHSRRWNWLSKEMTSTWPMINNTPDLPPYASGTSNNQGYGSAVRGYLPNGLAVIVDNNVSTTTNTNQDEIYVVPSTECHLWESPGAPIYIRAEQPSLPELGVLMLVYSYGSYSFERMPSGTVQKVGGTGLTTPSF